MVAQKPEIQALAVRAAHHQVERLVAPEANRLPAFAIENDMMEDLRRVFYFAKRIAHGVEEAESGKGSAPAQREGDAQ